MCRPVNYRMTDHYPFFSSSPLSGAIYLIYLSDRVIYNIDHAVDGNVNIPVQKEATRMLRVSIYQMFLFKYEAAETYCKNSTFSNANISEISNGPADPAPEFPCQTYLPLCLNCLFLHISPYHFLLLLY